MCLSFLMCDNDHLILLGLLNYFTTFSGEEDLAGSADPRTPGRRGRKRKEQAGVDEDEASPEKQQPTRRSARGQAAGQEKENQPQNSSSTETQQQQQILFNPNVEPDTPAPPTPAPPTPAGLQTPHHDRSQFENLGYDPASVPPTPAGPFSWSNRQKFRLFSATAWKIAPWGLIKIIAKLILVLGLNVFKITFFHRSSTAEPFVLEFRIIILERS